MPHLLVVILDDMKYMPDLLRAWHAIGVPGVTIFESVGGHRTSRWLSRVGLGALDRLFDAEEVRRRTLLVAIEEDDLLARAIAEAERVVGGFDRPFSGLLLALPVSHARGLRKAELEQPSRELPSVVWPDWIIQRGTPVEVALHVLDLEPTIVRPDTPLDEVARAMVAHGNVHVACVVAEDGRLVGLLSLDALADDLFFHIMPEEFMSEITDLEEVMEYAQKVRIRTAADAMQAPVSVKRDETVKDAFKRMHDHHLPGLPVVDDQYHVVGYINLLELMAVFIGRDHASASDTEASP
jgi:CBS domain-containing protein